MAVLYRRGSRLGRPRGRLVAAGPVEVPAALRRASSELGWSTAPAISRGCGSSVSTREMAHSCGPPMPEAEADIAIPGPSGMEALAVRYQGEIARFIRRSVPAADADDLCQETFLRAHRAYAALIERPEAQPRPWLYRIAANVCIDHLRRKSRRIVAPLVDGPRGGPGPDDIAIAREELARVRAAIEGLPARQRQALVLRRVYGLSYAATARMMGGSEEAARANVYQAIKRLKVVLDTGPSEEGAPWE